MRIDKSSTMIILNTRAHKDVFTAFYILHTPVTVPTCNLVIWCKKQILPQYLQERGDYD